MTVAVLTEEYQKILKSIDMGFLKDKSIAITGANGLIASYIVDLLSYANDEINLNVQIYAVSRSFEKLEKRFRPNKKLSLIEQDLNEPIKNPIEADYTIHCASNAHPLAYSLYPVETMKTNLLGTTNLLEMIKGKNTKFLYISSGEVYGNNENEKPFTENDCGKIDSKLVRSCYSESKRAAETICVSYAAEYGINMNVARLCYVYGPQITHDNSRADAQFLRNAINGEDIIMKSEGKQKRTYCYVADVVSAILFILSKGEKSETYNIANPASIHTVKEYAFTLAELTNVKVKFELPSDIEKKGYSKPLDSVLDASKLLNLNGWKPFYGLKEGIERTVEILRSLEKESRGGGCRSKSV